MYYELVKIFLESDNLDVVRTCRWELEKNKSCEDISWETGALNLRATILYEDAHKTIKRVSLMYPKDTITCRYRYQLEDYSEAHVVEYCNGDCKELNIEPFYWVLNSLSGNSTDERGIYNKAANFFRRLDIAEADKDGKLFLNWCEESITYHYEYEGEKGAVYRVEAYKNRNSIEFEVLKRSNGYKWDNIKRTVYDPQAKQFDN